MADRVGQQLGNYRLIRLLGRGGFAEVYLGEHLRLGTQAAVKVLHTRLASHDDVEGFEKEARTVAHLKHPHIVRVLDYDVEEDTPFLVMDYAVGGTLHNRHPRGTRLPLTTIISYVKQVADALQYAHDQHVIHRDIKPENMLVGEHNDLLLSDFGIAIVAQSSRYQHTQNMGGTMAYIAPEQIQGHPRPASDQYSLGIVVYEWLSGNCPFHGSITEIVAQHLAASPPSLHEKVPTIAPNVEQVVLRALEKDPRKRFSSVKAFATALELASQNTQASSKLPTVSPSSPPFRTEPEGQTLRTEHVPTERVISLEQPVSQVHLQSPLSMPPPTTQTQSVLTPAELRTGVRAGRESPENPGKESFLTPALSSFSIGHVAMIPKRKRVLVISVLVASVLLVALLNNGIVSRTLVRTPTPTPRAKPVPAGIITEFPIPSGNTSDMITAGPDGNLWFTEYDANKIGRISPSGTVTEFPVPSVKKYLGDITAGPDGNLWFTEYDANKIGRISPSGSLTEFPIPTASSGLSGITAGSDGNLWFREQAANKIGRISPSGSLTEFPLPNYQGNITAGPGDITAGPDGNLWCIEDNENKVERISPSGTITEFSIPRDSSYAANIIAGGITAGPDGNLWFTDADINRIWRISPSGSLTKFPVPTAAFSGLSGITAGPDGNLWFTEIDGNKIGRISPSGTVTEFPLPSANSAPEAITAGPGGNLWFTERNGNKIGRITSGR